MPYKNKEAIARAAKRYQAKHRVKIQEYNKRWYLEHREERLTAGKIYHKQTREHWNELNRQRRRNLKIEVITRYGDGKCACVKCGFSDVRALTIDHISGGGRRQKRQEGIKTGSAMYAWLKAHNYPEGYQTLCHNCQWIKRDEKHEYHNYLELRDI